MAIDRNVIFEVLLNALVTKLIEPLDPKVLAPVMDPVSGQEIDVAGIVATTMSNLADAITEGIMAVGGDIGDNADMIGDALASLDDVVAAIQQAITAAQTASAFVDISLWTTTLPYAGSATGITGIFDDPGTTTVAGYVYKLTGTTWEYAKADTVDTTTGSLAVAGGIDSSDDGMITSGFIRIPSGAIDSTADEQLTGGAPVYLSSSTPGGLQVNVPTSSHEVVRPLGTCLSYDAFSQDMLVHFHPDTVYVEISG